MKNFLLSTRKKEILITIGTNIFLQIITAICGFILPPLIVRTFGSETNGMVASITQFIAYLNIVEAGIGGASIAALYKPLAENDINGVNGILSATRAFYFRSGIIFTVLVFALSFVYPLIIGNQANKVTSGLMVLVVGITGAAEFFLIGKYRVLLTADRKTYVISLIQVVAVVTNTIVAVILIKLNFNILAVKLASSLVYLGRYFWIFLYVRIHYKSLNMKILPDRQAISQSKNLLIHQISALIVFNSPVVLITIFCSLKDASVYTMYAMVFSAVNQIIGSFSNGMQSFFGESLVKEHGEKTARIFGIYETSFFLALFVVYSLAYILIMPFMRIYTRNLTDAEYIQPVLGLLFVIVGIANNLRGPAGQVINAAGHFKLTQWRSVLESVINVTASVSFTLLYGFKGVLLGSIASYAYRTLDMIIYTNTRILRRKNFASFVKILFFGVVFIPISLFISGFLPECDSWLGWILMACLCGIVLVVPSGIGEMILLRRRVGR